MTFHGSTSFSATLTSQSHPPLSSIASVKEDL